MKISNKLRNKGLILVLLIAVILSLFSVPEIGAVVQTQHTLGAHRGSSVQFVENTVEAIQNAVDDEKYHFIEFDIQYTKDKKIIVFHDLSLWRLQKNKAKVMDLTYQELSEESFFHIPLYEDVISLIKSKKKINIEIKSQGNFEEDKQIVDFVINDLEERGILEETLFSSISPEVVHYISSTYPQIKTGQIFWVTYSTYFHTDYFTQQLYDLISQTGADYLMLH